VFGDKRIALAGVERGSEPPANQKAFEPAAGIGRRKRPR
jgi:hypothetical protein